MESFRNDSVRLSFGNEKVAQDNFQRLKEPGYPIATLNAKHNNSTAAKLSYNDMGSLQPKLLLSKGAKVMLTRNLWKSVGLCDGTLGKVLHIIYKDNDCPRSLPIAIIVQFEEGYTGPTFYKNIPNCVPITPVPAISDTLGSADERLQLPLRLAWSITIYKSQGLTLIKHG